MFFVNVNNKLMAEPADCHSPNVWVGDFPFDPGEEGEECITGKDVVEVLIGQKKNPLLLFINMIDFG